MNCEITYEQLGALAIGELDAKQAAEVREHLVQCERCRNRMAALNRIDEMLGTLRPLRPPASTVLATRRALAQQIRTSPVSEIMTLEEAADFLRITADQLGEIVEELPAFELAGQIRVRRDRLLEWVQQRERDYNRQRSESWVARAGKLGFGRGVA